ncbi:hypothetical protein TNCV_3425441 [Trichonephila clavipes]|nr:hypothetical protein TNCV_3425441 [Trichonephila clavipes]
MDIEKHSLIHRFKHVIEAQKKYNAYLDNFNKLKQTTMNNSDSRLQSKEENNTNSNERQDLSDDEIVTKDISPDNYCKTLHAEELYPKLRSYSSEESDIDVTGSASTVSLLQNVQKSRKNVCHNYGVEREDYPVNVVNVKLQAKKQKKQEKKTFAYVVQKGNFFEVTSHDPNAVIMYK